MTAPSSPATASSQPQSPIANVNHGWRSSLSVSDWLFAEGYRFEFIQALRLLEQFDSSIQGKASSEPAPGHEPFKLRSAVGFNFPASEIDHIQPPAFHGDKPELIANFFSLAGSSAPLPDWVAELLMQQMRHHDTGLRDFLDIFHHRLLSLLYRVRLRHRPWLDPALSVPDIASSPSPNSSQVRSQNRMAGYLLSFSGLGLHELRNRLPISDEEILPYAGLLWQRPRSSVGLQLILTHAFSVGISVIQMIGVWRTLEPDSWTRLGALRANGKFFLRSTGQNNALGHSAMLGTRAWDPQGRFDIVLGPLTFGQFQDFLPGGLLYRKLFALVRLYAGEHLDCGLRLRLTPSEVPKTHLGKSRLGWTSWLGTKPVTSIQQITLQAREYSTLH